MLSRLLPIRYFARSPAGTGNRWGWISDERFVPNLLDQLQGFDVYLTLNESRGSTARPVLEEITRWRGLVIDLDPSGADPLPPDDPWVLSHINMAVCGLLSLDLSPLQLYTGRGYQLWYLFPPLAPPAGAARAMRAFMLELNFMVAQAFPFLHVDPAVSDLCRLVRFPASVNQKTHRKVVALDAGAPSPDDSEIPGAILGWLPDDDSVRDHFPAATSVPADSPWGMYLPHLTRSASLYLNEGTDSGSRHDRACSTAYSLRENGCSEREILAALLYGNALCDDPLPPHEIARIVTTTHRRQATWVSPSTPSSSKPPRTAILRASRPLDSSTS